MIGQIGSAFNLIIPIAFLTAIYLWCYDQLLYIVPVVWISTRLLTKRRSYVPVLGFLMVLDLLSLVALAVQAYIRQD